jgi:hypothetical protein
MATLGVSLASQEFVAHGLSSALAVVTGTSRTCRSGYLRAGAWAKPAESLEVSWRWIRFICHLLGHVQTRY